MVEQALLFPVNVDITAWIFCVKIDKGDAGDLPRHPRHFPVGVRMTLPRMGIINDQFCQNLPLCALQGSGLERMFVWLVPC